MKQQPDKDLGRQLRDASRVVIKLGTNIVVGDDNEFSSSQIEPIVGSIADWKKSGRQAVLVSSGAVGLGAGKLKMARSRLEDLSTRQACAAVGQSLLMHEYEKLFGAHGISIAQVLLTEDDFMDWKRHRTLQRAMEKLLKLGVLPVINENDTVSTLELEYDKSDSLTRSFGDNDRLAALVMSKLDADALIILTNVDGLLRRSPNTRHKSPDDEALEVVPLVSDITEGVKEMAQGHSATGRGGMRTKLEAAEIAMQTGGLTVIANGTKADTLKRIFQGETIGTSFVSGAWLKGRRRWIAYAARVHGRLVVNAGARAALLGGKASLLAAGVIRIEDRFESMDVVSIVDDSGHEFARGMANCNSVEAEKMIRGESVATGNSNNSKMRVLVTRDNIVLTGS